MASGNPFRLEGATVVVTGAQGKIGAAIAPATAFVSA